MGENTCSCGWPCCYKNVWIPGVCLNGVIKNVPLFKARLLLAFICLRFLTSHFSATSCVFLSPFYPPLGKPATSLSNALNYTHHWFTENRIGTEALVFSLLPPLASCLSQSSKFNKNWQTNEGQLHTAAQGGLGLSGSPGDLCCVRGVLDV